MTVQTESTDPARQGFYYALSAYLLWGLLPLFLKAVAHIPAAEVVAHRILWSVPVAGLVLLALGLTKDVMAALKSPRTMMMVSVTAAVITFNWGLYVWAIAVDRTVESALGYYINPLVSVLMGAVLLGEKLNRFQMAAIGLAVLAVLILALEMGGVPWVSLALAFSFATYGYLRKTLPIGPSQGFFLEVLILTMPAIFYVLWLQARGESHFLPSQPDNMALLLGCGPVTAVPLILYAFGAKLLRYSTVGILQYIGPTLIFVIAVFFFHEPFGTTDTIAFGLIWLALVIYSWSMMRGRRAVRAA
jgi:chloramphenicol-sensitive protein RarD